MDCRPMHADLAIVECSSEANLQSRSASASPVVESRSLPIAFIYPFMGPQFPANKAADS